MSARLRNTPFPLTDPSSPVEVGRISGFFQDIEPKVQPIRAQRSSEEKTSILSSQEPLKPEQAALILAIDRYDKQTFMRLRGHIDADINFLINKDGTFPLLLAAAKGHTGILELMFQNPGLVYNKTDRFGANAFWIAAFYGRVETLSFLALKNVNQLAVNQNGSNALHIAVKKDLQDVVKELIAIKFPLNECKKNGVSAVGIAAYRGNIPVLEILVAAGVSLLQVNQQGIGALYLALKANQMAVIQYILNKDPGAFYQPGSAFVDNSCLFFAVKQNNMAALKMFIDIKGGSALEGLLDSEQKNVAQLAVNLDNWEAVNLLSARGMMMDTAKVGECVLWQCIKKGKFDFAKSLFQRGNDVNQPNQFGQTFLMEAIASRNFEAIKFLLQNGAQVHQEDNYGKDSCDYAKKNSIVQFPQLCNCFDPSKRFTAKTQKMNFSQSKHSVQVLPVQVSHFSEQQPNSFCVQNQDSKDPNDSKFRDLQPENFLVTHKLLQIGHEQHKRISAQNEFQREYLHHRREESLKALARQKDNLQTIQNIPNVDTDITNIFVEKNAPEVSEREQKVLKRFKIASRKILKKISNIDSDPNLFADSDLHQLDLKYNHPNDYVRDPVFSRLEMKEKLAHNRMKDRVTLAKQAQTDHEFASKVQIPRRQQAAIISSDLKNAELAVKSLTTKVSNAIQGPIDMFNYKNREKTLMQRAGKDGILAETLIQQEFAKTKGYNSLQEMQEFSTKDRSQTHEPTQIRQVNITTQDFSTEGSPKNQRSDLPSSDRVSYLNPFTPQPKAQQTFSVQSLYASTVHKQIGIEALRPSLTGFQRPDYSKSIPTKGKSNIDIVRFGLTDHRTVGRGFDASKIPTVTASTLNQTQEQQAFTNLSVEGKSADALHSRSGFGFKSSLSRERAIEKEIDDLNQSFSVSDVRQRTTVVKPVFRKIRIDTQVQNTVNETDYFLLHDAHANSNHNLTDLRMRDALMREQQSNLLKNKAIKDFDDIEKDIYNKNQGNFPKKFLSGEAANLIKSQHNGILGLIQPPNKESFVHNFWNQYELTQEEIIPDIGPIIPVYDPLLHGHGFVHPGLFQNPGFIPEKIEVSTSAQQPEPREKKSPVPTLPSMSPQKPSKWTVRASPFTVRSSVNAKIETQQPPQQDQLYKEYEAPKVPVYPQGVVYPYSGLGYYPHPYSPLISPFRSINPDLDMHSNLYISDIKSKLDHLTTGHPANHKGSYQTRFTPKKKRIESLPPFKYTVQGQQQLGARDSLHGNREFHAPRKPIIYDRAMRPMLHSERRAEQKLEAQLLSPLRNLSRQSGSSRISHSLSGAMRVGSPYRRRR